MTVLRFSVNISFSSSRDPLAISISLILARAQIFCLFSTVLKVPCLGHSKRPMWSCSLLPSLSGRPVIFHVFLGSAISVSHLGHLALSCPARKYIRPLMIFIVIFPLFTRS